ncbi:MAG: hypothetical protein SFT91_03430 [Rickettsiaceae bacterium]|nr:hypothetical protein [Rickettsiaceae bacterium]
MPKIYKFKQPKKTSSLEPTPKNKMVVSRSVIESATPKNQGRSYDELHLQFQNECGALEAQFQQSLFDGRFAQGIKDCDLIKKLIDRYTSQDSPEPRGQFKKDIAIATFNLNYNYGIAHSSFNTKTAIEYMKKAYEIDSSDQDVQEKLWEYYNRDDNEPGALLVARKMTHLDKDIFIAATKIFLGGNDILNLKDSVVAIHPKTPRGRELKLNFMIYYSGKTNNIEDLIKYTNLKIAIDKNSIPSSYSQGLSIVLPVFRYCGLFEEGCALLQEYYDQRGYNLTDMLPFNFEEFIFLEFANDYERASEKLEQLRISSSFNGRALLLYQRASTIRKLTDIQNDPSKLFALINNFENLQGGFEKQKSSSNGKIIVNQDLADLILNAFFPSSSISDNSEDASDDTSDSQSEGSSPNQTARTSVDVLKESGLGRALSDIQNDVGKVIIEERASSEENLKPSYSQDEIAASDSSRTNSEDSGSSTNEIGDNAPEEIEFAQINSWDLDQQNFHQFCQRKKEALAKKHTNNVLGQGYVASWLLEDGSVLHAKQKHIIKISGRENSYLCVKKSLNLSKEFLDAAKTVVSKSFGSNGLKFFKNAKGEEFVEIKVGGNTRAWSKNIYKNSKGEILIVIDGIGGHQKASKAAYKQIEFHHVQSAPSDYVFASDVEAHESPSLHSSTPENMGIDNLYDEFKLLGKAQNSCDGDV